MFTLSPNGTNNNDDSSDSPQDPFSRSFSYPYFVSAPPSPPIACTPSAADMYTDLRRSLSVKGLRDLQMAEFQHHVWRPPNQHKKYPTDLDRLIVHTVRGAVRAFVLAYSARAGVNLVLVFFSSIRDKRLRFSAIRHAFFGPSAYRFGGMFAAFAAIWRWTYHGLRIYNPGPMGKGQYEFWHAPLAGALSALSILVEKRENRVGVAQQVFVRGLQGAFNIGSHKGIIRIPHGDVLVFGFACSRIMYAWLMSPETLPPGYGQWISNAGNISKDAMLVHLSSRTGYWPLSAPKNALMKSNVAPKNRKKLEKMLRNAIHGDYGTPYMPCCFSHPESDSCILAHPIRAVHTWKFMLPVYSALHFIPPILFRRKTFTKNPKAMLKRSAIGTARSCTFLMSFVFIYMFPACIHRNLWDSYVKRMGPAWRKFWLSKHFYWICGFATCLSLFVEEKKRRAELAMYVLPKALESYWKSARRNGYVPRVPHGDLLLASSGLAMVMSSYTAHPEQLSGLVRALLYQFLGRA